MFEAPRRIHTSANDWPAGTIVNRPILGVFNGVALHGIGLLFGTPALCQGARPARATQIVRH